MSDDLTKELPEPKYETPPGITAVLERINQIGENLKAEIAEVRSGQEQLKLAVESLRDELQSFRTETLEKFSQMNSKFDVLNNELLDLKAEQRRHGRRIDELERKAS
jgi:uncharacterized coiled-coil DUF342 family protein